MNYRDILGMSDKQPKKKVVKKHKPTITENLKKQFGDTINEGPAMEYVNDVKQIEKTEKLKAKAVKNLAKVLDKKGFKKEAKNLNYVYSIYEDKFSSYIQELMNKLQ